MIVSKCKSNKIYTLTYCTLLEGNGRIVRAIAKDLTNINHCSYDIIIDDLCSGIED